MSAVVPLALLVGGVVLVVAGAELFFEGLLAAAARLGVSAFALMALVSFNAGVIALVHALDLDSASGGFTCRSRPRARSSCCLAREPGSGCGRSAPCRVRRLRNRGP